ncbi:hypothetical protein LJC59_01735 [Desulfovibrio sp. OttesenSCG-928-A18]|nr:hypothetical protein [Desulfovibrio sp. OttesenSCG-928-A18]
MEGDFQFMYAAGGAALLIIALSIRVAVRSANKDQQCLALKSGQIGAATATCKNPSAWLEAGRALLAAASAAKNAPMRIQKYEEASDCFRKATEVANDNTQAWRNRGQSQYALFRLKGCQDRLLLNNAHTAFQSAARLAPADAAVWQDWGEELYLTGMYCSRDDDRRELQELAKNKYAKAVHLDPGRMEAWQKWGGSAQALADIRDEQDGDAIRSAGLEQDGQAEAMPEPGSQPKQPGQPGHHEDEAHSSASAPMGAEHSGQSGPEHDADHDAGAKDREAQMEELLGRAAPAASGTRTGPE